MKTATFDAIPGRCIAARQRYKGAAPRLACRDPGAVAALWEDCALGQIRPGSRRSCPARAFRLVVRAQGSARCICSPTYIAARPQLAAPVWELERRTAAIETRIRRADGPRQDTRGRPMPRERLAARRRSSGPASPGDSVAPTTELFPHAGASGRTRPASCGAPRQAGRARARRLHAAVQALERAQADGAAGAARLRMLQRFQCRSTGAHPLCSVAGT